MFKALNLFSFPKLIKINENQIIIGINEKYLFQKKLLKLIILIATLYTSYFFLTNFVISSYGQIFLLIIAFLVFIFIALLIILSSTKIIIYKDKSEVIFIKKVIKIYETKIKLEIIEKIALNCVCTGIYDGKKKYSYILDFIDKEKYAYNIYVNEFYDDLFNLGLNISNELKINFDDNTSSVDEKYCAKRIV